MTKTRISNPWTVPQIYFIGALFLLAAMAYPFLYLMYASAIVAGLAVNRIGTQRKTLPARHIVPSQRTPLTIEGEYRVVRVEK